MKQTILYLLAILLILQACNKKNVASESIRKVISFNLGWKFMLGDTPRASIESFDDSAWPFLNLPHDWSIEADFSIDNPTTPGGGALPGGIGWYRKTFTPPAADKGKITYIDFDGVYWNSTVWINGQLLGQRPNGYISFRYNLTPYLKYGQPNTIVVRVDNSQQPNSRWYTGSGIYRNVRLVTVNPLHIAHWGTYVTTENISARKADVNLRITLENNSANLRQAQLVSIIKDNDGQIKARATTSVTVPKDEKIETTQAMMLNQPQLWSDTQPYLYTIITQVIDDGRIIDEYNTPLGVRSFAFDHTKGFLLNGEPVIIKGVCQHHDLGCLGTAVNIRAMERQLEILKQMGCNAIRTAHNPPAPELLDLCDQMGFIVQNEAFDMWHKRKSPQDYSHFFSQWHERDLTDLILRDRNHPSVFMWSIGNEILEQWTDMNVDTLDLQQANILFNFASKMNKDAQSDDLHVNSLLTIKLANLVKSLDPTRPVTSGNNEARPVNHLFKSGAMEILGFNYNHNLWSELPQIYPGQKYIITESTSSLMTRGYYEMPSDHTFTRPERWDIPYENPGNQCSAYDNSCVPWGTTHEHSWQLIKKCDFLSGLYIWTGFDYLGEPTPYWWPSRSSYFGIIDLAGFPKDIYYMYQSEWTDTPVLHLFPHWNWKPGQTIDIWAYYNQADEVELFLNNKSLGKSSKNGDDLKVWWRVPYQVGTLKAISRKGGKEILVREIKTAGTPVSLRLTADRQIISADGTDLSFITVEVLDTDGYPVPVANNMINFSVEGNGFIVGTDNGNPTDHLSLKKPGRKLFNGKALVVVQSNGKRGSVEVKATAEGLKMASVTIKCK
ncbi:glycoside hydrolase family 2 TIM barrel-domain containing protein [Proteiniphilum sp. UBA5510]|uniref:glycoside hydrolase family 2 TIM barrel-domain containing protein n=1 Tax=Proteiniphilum sp. UBA5510 TaxID=1947286 RepID=UPI00257C4423|nr:glycoside hydrolase family 2 TIM barrel-domain containing protein [Proteiniphilum sp. UBA5510]